MFIYELIIRKRIRNYNLYIKCGLHFIDTNADLCKTTEKNYKPLPI